LCKKTLFGLYVYKKIAQILFKNNISFAIMQFTVFFKPTHILSNISYAEELNSIPSSTDEKIQIPDATKEQTTNSSSGSPLLPENNIIEQPVETSQGQTPETSSQEEINKEDTASKEQILEIINDQVPVNLPVKEILQEDSTTFVSEQKSLGIEVAIDTEENSVMLGEDGIEITIGMPNADAENVDMDIIDGQMVSDSDELNVVVQSIEGGMRQIIKIDSKDADGNDIPTHYTIEGTTLRQHVDLEKAKTFPVIADPIWCGDAIKSVKWIYRKGDKHQWSASVIPTVCGTWLGSFQWGGWQEVVDKTPKSVHWDKKYGTSKYWSMHDQYFCHADWAGGFKTPWNLEPTRPNVGYSKTVATLCNP
jgi:hypothetical protein